MTAFVSIALALVTVALLWLLPALLRHRGPRSAVEAGASNLAILRDQLRELGRDLDNGTLSAQQYQQAREDLERRTLEEPRDAAPPTPASEGRPAHARWTALALAVAVPLCAGLLYYRLGSPDALSDGPSSANGHGSTDQQVASMVTRLAARLEKAPDDGEGWALLGRSYFVMQRYADAANAYARATALIKDDADLLADYADALAMSKGRKIDDEVMKITDQALAVDDYQWKALAIAGSGAFSRNDYKKAVAYWERLQQRAEPNSKLYQDVTDNLAEARKLGNMKPAAVAKSASAAKPAPAGQPALAGATVQGKISLSPALAGKANPTDTVFIFARAVQGPRMPLAIIRRQVRDLPFTFSLDDSQAMAPEMKLSKFGEVVVGARISKSANAMPQSGDLQGSSATVKVGAANVMVVIDSVVP